MRQYLVVGIVMEMALAWGRAWHIPRKTALRQVWGQGKETGRAHEIEMGAHGAYFVGIHKPCKQFGSAENF